MSDYRQIAIQKTWKHIERVRALLKEAEEEIHRRGAEHDRSKFQEEEIGPLAKIEEIIARDGQAPFGSEEYEHRRQMLAPMLMHHYAKNSHHPEHYEKGINGMDLFDIIEMFFDWKAASERGEESTMGLETAIKRFYIEPQLADILRNTATRLGYAT